MTVLPVRVHEGGEWSLCCLGPANAPRAAACVLQLPELIPIRRTGPSSSLAGNGTQRVSRSSGRSAAALPGCCSPVRRKLLPPQGRKLRLQVPPVPAVTHVGAWTATQAASPAALVQRRAQGGPAFPRAALSTEHGSRKAKARSRAQRLPRRDRPLRPPVQEVA